MLEPNPILHIEKYQKSAMTQEMDFCDDTKPFLKTMVTRLMVPKASSAIDGKRNYFQYAESEKPYSMRSYSARCKIP